MSQTITAQGLLQKANQHMVARGVQYDSPEGERSMGKTVAALNATTGQDMTEAQGWAMMIQLKLTRLFQRPGYHADSAEDLVAYATLLGEAKAKEAALEQGGAP